MRNGVMQKRQADSGLDGSFVRVFMVVITQLDTEQNFCEIVSL